MPGVLYSFWWSSTSQSDPTPGNRSFPLIAEQGNDKTRPLGILCRLVISFLKHYFITNRNRHNIRKLWKRPLFLFKRRPLSHHNHPERGRRERESHIMEWNTKHKPPSIGVSWGLITENLDMKPSVSMWQPPNKNFLNFDMLIIIWLPRYCSRGNSMSNWWSWYLCSLLRNVFLPKAGRGMEQGWDGGEWKEQKYLDLLKRVSVPSHNFTSSSGKKSFA